MNLSTICYRICLALALLLAPAILHAQTWDRTVIWERVFGDNANVPVNPDLAVDQRGHIHLLASPGYVEPYIRGEAVSYIQLLPNGDSVRHLRLADSGYIYSRVALRIGTAASPALCVMRDRSSPYDPDDSAHLLLIRISADGEALDTTSIPLPASIYGQDGNASGSFDGEGNLSLAASYGWAAGGCQGMVLMRFDSAGDFLWSQDACNIVGLCAGSGGASYLAVQYMDESGFNFSASVEKVDSSSAADSTGWPGWHKLVTDDFGCSLLERAIAPDGAGGVVTVAHHLVRPSRRVHPVIARVSADTQFVWRRLLDTLPGRDRLFRACCVAPDGGYLFVGFTAENHDYGSEGVRKQFYLMKTDANGRTLWTWEYGTDTTEDLLTGIAFSGDTIIVTGAQDEKLYVAKLRASVAGVTRDDSPLATMQITPNPATAEIAARAHLNNRGSAVIEIADLRGEVVQTLNLGDRERGEVSTSLNVESLAAGRYLLRLLVDGRAVAAGSFIRE